MSGPRGITDALRERQWGDSRDTWRRGKIEGSAATDGREATTSQGMPATPEGLLPLGGFRARGIDFELVVSPASV